MRTVHKSFCTIGMNCVARLDQHKQMPYVYNSAINNQIRKSLRAAQLEKGKVNKHTHTHTHIGIIGKFSEIRITVKKPHG